MDIVKSSSNRRPSAAARPRDGRERLIAGATSLLAERGYEATDLREAAARGDAPRGSIYHHFPGGKSELAAAAARRRAETITAAIEESLSEVGPVETLDRFLQFFRRQAGGDAARLGCPVAAVTLAPVDDPALREVAGMAVRMWESALAAGLRRHGVIDTRAQTLAALVISAVEGAIIRARALDQIDALEEPLEALKALLAHEIPQSISS